MVGIARDYTRCCPKHRTDLPRRVTGPHIGYEKPLMGPVSEAFCRKGQGRKKPTLSGRHDLQRHRHEDEKEQNEGKDGYRPAPMVQASDVV